MENHQNAADYVSVSNIQNLYDLSMLEEMEDNEYMVEVLNIFLKEAPAELTAMKEALRTRKTEIISQNAHKMKGSAGVIQAYSLIEYLHRIEMLGKAGVIDDEIISLVENAGKHYSRIEQALKQHIKELN